MRRRKGRAGPRRDRVQGSVRPGYPLTISSSGEWVRVVTITSDHAAESRLVSMGINPGALLHVISSSSRGPIVVARDETRFGIDRKTAWHVRVVPASPKNAERSYPVFCDDDCRGCSYRTEMMRVEYGESITLDSLKPGETGRVISVRGREATLQRLKGMGFVKGAVVRVLSRSMEPDLTRVEIDGRSVEMEGWDSLHVILEVMR